jgi:hypothetical protein
MSYARLRLLLESAEERKGPPLLTNEEVYEIYNNLADHIVRLDAQNKQLRITLTRLGGLHPLT